jgi:DNA-binding Lrp family transcriptional regulator
MKVSEEQGRILRVIECAADMPLTEVAKRARVKLHSVRYHLKRFRDSGLLKERLFINTYRLGFTRYAIFFSVSGRRGSPRSELIKKLQRHDKVALVLEVGGEFQFEINVVVRIPAELQEFLDWMSKECGEGLGGKAVCVQLSHRLFGMKSLWAHGPKLPELDYGVVSETVLIDKLDHDILVHYSSGSPTLREAGSALGVSASTVEARLKKLKVNGVISGSSFVIDGIPMLHWVILVHTSGLDSEMRHGIVAFARAHPLVNYTVECLGGWDVELGVSASDAMAPTQVVEELYRAWGAQITKTQVLPLFARHKVVDYPFKALPYSERASERTR